MNPLSTRPAKYASFYRFCCWLICRRAGLHVGPATEVLLARELGVTTRTFRRWKNRPDLDAELERVARQRLWPSGQSQADLFAF